MAWVVAVFSVAILSVLTGLEGTSSCGLQKCYSENYTFTDCELSDILMVINVTIRFEISESNCTFYDDSFEKYNGTDGVYGYCDGTIWVDRGCRAYFEYCMSDSSSSEARNCSTDMTTSTPSSLTTTYTSNTPNSTTTTVQTENQTAYETTNVTSPSPTASNQTASEAPNATSTSPTAENQTSTITTDSTLTTTNETHDAENSTTSTMTSFSATPSTGTPATSSIAPSTMSTTGETTDPNDDDVWQIPIYAGIIIIVVVMVIFLGCGILLIYLLCQRGNRRYAKSLVDIRDESDWKTQNLRRYHNQELHTAVKNRNTVGALGEIENEKTTAYLTPVSDTRPRTKDNQQTALEESVGYLDVRTAGKIGFLNPRYKNNDTAGKDGNTDAMVQSGGEILSNQNAESTGTNKRVFQQSDGNIQTDGYESVSPVDVKETIQFDDEQTDM